jgi:hypothetical protein
MYFFKMRRASALLEALATGPVSGASTASIEHTTPEQSAGVARPEQVRTDHNPSTPATARSPSSAKSTERAHGTSMTSSPSETPWRCRRRVGASSSRVKTPTTSS